MKALQAAMAERTDEELTRILTEDAPDYTEEALAAARDELTRRGGDPSALTARRGPPRGPPAESTERVKRLAIQSFGAFLVLGLGSALLPPLRVAAVAAFWIAVLLGLVWLGRR